MSDSFCRRPFTDLVVEHSGVLTPCCLVRLTEAGKREFNETDFTSYARSSSLDDLRQALQRGEKPAACQVCWNNERLGGGSLRMNRPPRDLIEDRTFGEVHIKTSSVCNFKCRICQPSNSSAWLAEQKENGFAFNELIEVQPVSSVQYALHDPNFRQELLEDILPATRMIRISGGEPLVCSDTLKFFKELIAHGLHRKHYRVFTNLSVLNFAGTNYLEFWRQFPNLRLIVSCDGAGESVEYSRTGLAWTNFLTNLEAAKHLVSDVNCVLSVFSVYSIPYLLEICAKLNIRLNIEPEFYKTASIQILPPAEKQRIKEHYAGIRGNLVDVPEQLFERAYAVIKSDLEAEDLSTSDFPQKFKIKNSELDRRRHTDFCATFPQLAEWYGSIAVPERRIASESPLNASPLT